MSEFEIYLTIALSIIYLKMSAVWHYFKINRNEAKATCIGK